MKVLVCGSRDWVDAEAIEQRLLALDAEASRDGEYVEVLHGAARGADRLAGRIATGLNLEVVVFPADWNGLGKRAGFVRNVQMLNEGPDLVLAFQVNGSRGTQHTIDEARRRGIPVEVFTR